MTVSSVARRPIDPDLFVGGDPDAALRGARCPTCGTVTFPFQNGCPRCGATAMASVELPREGTLWSYTVQSFAPKRPFVCVEPFEPFGVGYIDLGDVIVESRLTVADAGAMRIDMPMRLTHIVNHVDDDSTEVVTFAFEPIGEEE
ncbi:Zn-ribbon domain-containing OB-fold protein [Rhodococcus chondri]|uniref:OB-fold domain-containing protein n=1 Tax=Rhodococcus chondri TaxID=3065941 RepID=A0ABU7JT50_9NOCA|nr:OB-fold domain-containing protein [Rhodococcus sp. CC-R104]MEE2033196.1 OB-fold domain-containing protein [Rhodococcus sp. CC-R104]